MRGAFTPMWPRPGPGTFFAFSVSFEKLPDLALGAKAFRNSHRSIHFLNAAGEKKPRLSRGSNGANAGGLGLGTVSSALSNQTRTAADCSVPSKLSRQSTATWNTGSAWLRPRIAPLAIMVAAAASALPGRVFPLPRGTMPPARSSRWRIVERRAFEEAGGIVGVRPCGRGEDEGEG
jgi:hypothetical protein